MRKKRALTLLEVIISLSLTAILLAVLMGGTTRLFTLRSRIETAKEGVLSKMLIEQRLSSLFLNLAKHSTAPEGLPPNEPKAPLESPDGKSLSILLENQIDPDPAFCGSIQGTLLLENQQLILQLLGKNDAIRKEVLLEQVSDISLQFFDPFEEPPHCVEMWHEKGRELPPYIILKLTAPSLEGMATFAFFFPTHDNFIVYHPPIKSSEEVRK